MGIKQTWIFGVILTLAGIGTLAASILFFIFSNKQVIHVGAFDGGFDYALSLRPGDPDYSDWYRGEHGFRFRTAVLLPTAELDTGPPHPIPIPAAATSSGVTNEPPPPFHGFHPEEAPPPSALAEYLENKKSSLLVLNAFGDVPGVLCYIPRYRDSALFGIVTSLLQILASLLYIFWKEKNIRTMSAFFYSYFFIFLTHLACLCIVLNGKPNRIHGYLTDFGYARKKADIFAGIMGLNCLVLLTLTVLTCVTCNTEEYMDRCIDQDTCNRKRTGSSRNILSTNASTDRLNK